MGIRQMALLQRPNDCYRIFASLSKLAKARVTLSKLVWHVRQETSLFYWMLMVQPTLWKFLALSMPFWPGTTSRKAHATSKAGGAVISHGYAALATWP